MKVLNLYSSITGNTQKVAEKIEATVRQIGHEVETIKASKGVELNLLDYDFVFVGSGVYHWLPIKALMELIDQLRCKYVRTGEIKPPSPRRPGKKAVVYCTYGGSHTGVNEAVPVVKYMGQLFDHLGFEIIDEWHIVGEFHGKYQHLSASGRLGDIHGRPNEADLQNISQKVIGIMSV